MEKIITIISTENLTVEDYFKGNHEAHEVKGLENTYALVRPKTVLGTGTIQITKEQTEALGANSSAI